MKRKTPNRFKVQDKHTGATVKRYATERAAVWSAAKLCDLWGKGRYIVVPL